ncbi:hypothetical protein [Algoriphagus chordae]|uniref:Uncharacterized protein n=1 Tax=Algoriphagus chordae TaxID=237019 RepID=A0A2W7QNY2_9BACT|nr:hypothetical protein [Algoriphagus chordae]PZX50248.1 hypothetical protein LV85_02866 [Algoriphagus chordae]
MKKLIFVFMLLGGMMYLSSSQVIAQTVTTATKAELKTQEKLLDSKVKLEKYEQDHEKAIEKRQDLRADFEKKNSSGKLSPNDVEKMTKKMDKQSKSIEKLEKKMDKLKKYIAENS